MNKIKVLLIEDDRSISNFITATMDREGYKIMHALNGREGLSLSTSFCPNVILLDLGLPDMDGLEVLQKLRSWSDVPVIIISARTKEQEKVSALDLGADDYMVKPFELAELEARVRALTRRATGNSPAIVCGSLSFDPVGRVTQIAGVPLDLSAREIGLLEILLARMGRLVSKDQLVDHLCGWGEEVSHNAIEVYVHRLRKKLESGGIKIATVRGLGYCLERPQGE